MITLEKLNSFGADTEEGLSRCYSNESLYLRLVAMIPKEKNFEKLNESLNKGDLHAAFEAAHALKGVLGNLSLTPLYEKVTDITELLRAGTDMDYSSLKSEILSMRDELKKLCED